MKRTANIAILSLSVLLILIMPFFPHHHHEDVECAIMERCLSDNTYNDEHTVHNAGSDSSDNPLCIKNLKSIEVRSKITKDFDAVHLLPLLVAIYNYFIIDVNRQATPLYDGYRISYLSRLDSKSLSLRAPPFLS